MGKQAKKKQKSDTQAAEQKIHNRATRFSNTKNRQIIWDKKKRKKENGLEDTYLVTYPPNTQWDWSKIYDAAPDQDGTMRLVRKKSDKQPPLYEPYDMLLEDWEDGIRGYAEQYVNAKIEREQLSNGRFIYTVFQKVKDNKNKEVKLTLLTIESPRNIHFGGNKKFRKRRK